MLYARMHPYAFMDAALYTYVCMYIYACLLLVIACRITSVSQYLDKMVHTDIIFKKKKFLSRGVNQYRHYVLIRYWVSALKTRQEIINQL